MLQLLETYPAGCVETIAARLEQKHEEFERVKADMQAHWQKQYDANYINSLDHRSFYFKQSDRKHLSVKALVADMKELASKRASAPESLPSFAPGKPTQTVVLNPSCMFCFANQEAGSRLDIPHIDPG